MLSEFLRQVLTTLCKKIRFKKYAKDRIRKGKNFVVRLFMRPKVAFFFFFYKKKSSLQREGNKHNEAATIQ